MTEAPGEFIAVLTPVRPGMVVDGPLPEEMPVLASHLAWLEQMAADGHLVLAGRTQEADPSTFGIVILRADTAERAETLARQDPAVAGGLLHLQVRPFRIAVRGP